MENEYDITVVIKLEYELYSFLVNDNNNYRLFVRLQRIPAN